MSSVMVNTVKHKVPHAHKFVNFYKSHLTEVYANSCSNLMDKYMEDLENCSCLHSAGLD